MPILYTFLAVDLVNAAHLSNTHYEDQAYAHVNNAVHFTTPPGTPHRAVLSLAQDAP